MCGQTWPPVSARMPASHAMAVVGEAQVAAVRMPVDKQRRSPLVRVTSSRVIALSSRAGWVDLSGAYGPAGISAVIRLARLGLLPTTTDMPTGVDPAVAQIQTTKLLGTTDPERMNQMLSLAQQIYR